MTTRFAAVLLGLSAVAGCMSSGRHGHQLGGGGGARTSVTSVASAPSHPSSWRAEVRAAPHRHDLVVASTSQPGPTSSSVHVRDHRDHEHTTEQTNHGTLDAILGIAEDLVPAVAEALLTGSGEDLVADRGDDPRDPTATIVDPCETCPLEDPCGTCTGYGGNACRDNASGVMSRCESSSAPNLRGH